MCCFFYNFFFLTSLSRSAYFFVANFETCTGVRAVRVVFRANKPEELTAAFVFEVAVFVRPGIRRDTEAVRDDVRAFIFSFDAG